MSLRASPVPHATLSRWRLFYTSLPVAIALTALKLALDELLGFKGFIEFNSDLNVIFTALVFIWCIISTSMLMSSVFSQGYACSGGTANTCKFVLDTTLHH